MYSVCNPEAEPGLCRWGLLMHAGKCCAGGLIDSIHLHDTLCRSRRLLIPHESCSWA